MNHQRHLLILCLLASSLALSGCGGQSPDSLVASAKTYLAKNDRNAAIIQLKTALQKDPQHAQARFLLGQALLATGDASGASAELRRALDLHYSTAVVLPVLARAMLGEGHVKPLVDQYAGVDLPDPAAAADLKTSVAIAYADLGNTTQADAAISAALKAAPDFAPALILRAQMLARGGDADAALKAIDAVLQKYPGQANAWQLKGDLLYLGKGDSVAALQAYRQALVVKKDLLAAHTAIISVYFSKNDIAAAQKQLEEARKFFPNQPQIKYFDALLALQRHDLVKARQLAQELLRLAPDYARALQLAGAVEYERGSFGQAEKYLTQALQRAPDNLPARRMLAQTYLRSGQSDKALATLLPVVEKGAPDAEAFSLIGEAYLQSGDTIKAQDYYSRAAKLNPKDVKSRTALALTHLSSGNADAAFSELQNIAAGDHGTTADLALISALIQRNELDKALSAVDALEKKQPDKPLAASLRGKIQLSRRDFTGARKSFERAVAIDPAYFPAVDSLAALDVAAGKIDDAKSRFDKLLALEPSNYRALLAIAGLRATAGGSKEEVTELINKAIKLNPTQVAPRLVLVDQYIKGKDLARALTAVQDALAAIPDNPQLLQAQGQVLVLSKEYNQAISAYTKLATLLPQSPYPQLLLADVHMALKDNDMARQSLKRALAVAPDNLQAQRNLVALELAAGRSQEALAVAREVQKQRSDEGIGYLFEGDIDVSLKNLDAAAEAYRAGLKKRKSTDLAVKLHSVLLTGGHRADADKFSAGWMKEYPKDAAFLFHLGDVALAQGNYAQAETYYVDVVQLRPDDAPALNNAAWVASKLKKPGAVAYAEKANSLRPGQPLLMDTLAMVLADDHQYERAVKVQRSAMELQPQNPALRLTLAKIYIQSGDKVRAKDELEKLSAIGPKFSGHDEVNQLMKSL